MWLRYALSLHVRGLFNAWTQVLLVYGEHAVDWLDVAIFELGLDLLLAGKVLVLQIDVASIAVLWHHVR